MRALLDDVAQGKVEVEAALASLDAEPIETLAHTTVDHHRALRSGYPEVVFGEGKTTGQVVEICRALADRSASFLVTRASTEHQAALVAAFPDAVVNTMGRTVRWRGAADRPASTKATVAIVTAGTSDLPVAEEAAETLAAIGIGTRRLTDVGVAGIHRLLARTTELQSARATIVIAGMDGALPSVVGGITRGPVIAVPTSVGYGASFGGLAALLTMLNSCAAGVTVCNIDNGFGAAMAAARAIGD